MGAVKASLDFSRLLDPTFASQMMPAGAILAEQAYDGSGGVQFRTAGRDSQLVQEVVRVSDEALLLASDAVPAGESVHHQILNDSDWIHIQFRLSGDGHESVSDSDVIEIAPRSCVVVRYPEGSVVKRTTHATNTFQAACLLLRPQALRSLLDVPASGLPIQSVWMAQEGRHELRSAVLPLNAAMVLAVSDVISCRHTGIVRRSFMRAKSLELLASVIHSLSSPASNRDHREAVLSTRDASKIRAAYGIIQQELGSSITLAALAKRVGLNRTKLAFGFKKIYGVSVQAHWRDEKLRIARELLQGSGKRVTEVALSLGYSEVSSFARAFQKKFGFLPGALRSGRRV